MSAGICLPKKVIDSFKEGLIEGTINPEQLADMTSDQRREVFTKIVGEGNARFVNSQFESKLLLKNQQAGFLRWAKKLAGVTPDVKRDLISRINKLDHILDPTEEKAFLKDLASAKLGVEVSAKEAKQIAGMSKDLRELEAKRKPDGTFPSESDRMAYGRAKVAFGSHIADLKNNAAKLDFTGTVIESAMHPLQAVTKVAGLAKSLKASLDNSAIFRQGWKSMWTNPVAWQRNARKTFTDIAKQLGGQDTIKEVQADIVSRPNADKYTKMGLAIDNVEEAFPTSLPEKVPLLGRVYKASEGAYTGFLYRQRADIADKMLEIAEKSGVDITNKEELRAIGKMINSLTGRGDFGKYEGSLVEATNNILFSPRFVKSQFDTLGHVVTGAGGSNFVRKRAAINLVKIVTGTAAVLTIANAVKPGSVELDPRSSNFGKIKVGHTTFDVTGGMGSVVVLASRLIKNQTKSASTGVVTDLGSGFGSTSRFDVVVDYFSGKAAPVGAVLRDFAKGEDFEGNKPDLVSTTKNLFVPIPIANAMKEDDPYAANKLVQSIADGLGISTNTNTPSRNLSQDLSSTQQAFKDKVGRQKFNQANDEYNKQYNEWLASHKDELKNLPQDEQQSTITSIKSKIQKKIYEKYDFKPPKSSKPSEAKKSLLDSIK